MFTWPDTTGIGTAGIRPEPAPRRRVDPTSRRGLTPAEIHRSPAAPQQRGEHVMTLHKIALATIMTSATALGAFAADDKIFEKGHAKPDPADVAASPNERVDIDTYDERGHTRKSVGTETTMEEDAGIMDDLSAVEPVSVA